MTLHPFRKPWPALALFSAFALVVPMLAAAATIETPAEANQITVTFIGAEAGAVAVNECTRCPLSLVFDANTHFYVNNKEIRRDRVNAASGKPGTVIYDRQSNHALRIYW